MGINTEHRRRITVGEMTYLWYVALDDDSDYYILNVVSPDKQLILSCPLGTETPYVISKGPKFRNEGTIGWNRFLLPFDVPKVITPGFVKKLIVWADENSDAVSVGGINFPV
jgi:hypothetical protein